MIFKVFIWLFGATGSLMLFIASVSPEYFLSNIDEWAKLIGIKLPEWVTSEYIHFLVFVAGDICLIVALVLLLISRHIKKIATI